MQLACSTTPIRFIDLSGQTHCHHCCQLGLDPSHPLHHCTTSAGGVAWGTLSPERVPLPLCSSHRVHCSFFQAGFPAPLVERLTGRCWKRYVVFPHLRFEWLGNSDVDRSVCSHGPKGMVWPGWLGCGLLDLVAARAGLRFLPCSFSTQPVP